MITLQWTRRLSESYNDLLRLIKFHYYSLIFRNNLT